MEEDKQNNVAPKEAETKSPPKKPMTADEINVAAKEKIADNLVEYSKEMFDNLQAEIQTTLTGYDLLNEQHELDLSKKLERRLPSSLFPLPALRHLDISNNSLGYHDDIPLDTTQDKNDVSIEWITSLVSLNVSGNHLSDLGSERAGLHRLFGPKCGETNHLCCLKVLNASFNSLSELPTSLSSLNLERLCIASNNFNCIPIELSSNSMILQTLTDLDISNNEIAELKGSDLAKLSNLESLNLGSNNLKDLPQQMSSYSGFSKHLKKLDLSENMINILPDVIGELFSLRTLIVSNNKLKELPPTIFTLHDLIHLDCSHNEMNKIWGVSGIDLARLSVFNSPFSQPHYNSTVSSGLMYIDVSYNNISDDGLVKAGLEKCKALTTINLSHNRLCTLPPTSKLHYASINHFFAEYNKIKGLEFNGSLLNLNTLVVGHNKISKIHPSLCTAAINIQYFDIEYNEVDTIPISIGHLDKLKVLKLNNNHIDSLPETFMKLKKLEKLFLFGNPLSVFGSILGVDEEENGEDTANTVLKYLRGPTGDRMNISTMLEKASSENWSKLDMSNSHLQEIPAALINLKSSLTDLDLAHNVIEVLPDSFGRLLENLKSLNLSENLIKSIPTSAFVEVTTYESDKVTADSGDESWAERLLDKSKRLNWSMAVTPQKVTGPRKIPSHYDLESLYLHSNPIEYGATDLSKFTHLRRLGLGNTGILSEIRHVYDVSSIGFGSRTVLSSLSLTGEVLSVLTSLEVLELWCNSLQGIPPEIGFLLNLSELNVCCNNLVFLPPEIGLLRGLKYLNVANNKLTALPVELQACHFLVSVIAGHNRISNLESDWLKGNMNLEELYVNNNSITRLCSELWSCISLKHIDISHNKIPHWFYSENCNLIEEKETMNALLPLFSSLIELDCSHNMLKVMPSALFGLLSLKALKCSHNLIESVEFVPDKVTSEVTGSLEYLDLSYNALQVLPLSIENVKSLRRIKLDGNMLVTLPPQISHLSSLTSLSIWSNKLTTLPHELAECESLKYVYAGENEISGYASDLFKHGRNNARILGLIYTQSSKMTRRRSDRQKQGDPVSLLRQLMENNQDQSTLSLSGHRLRGLPVQLWSLQSLTILDLSDNRLNETALIGIEKFSALETLILSRNQCTAFPVQLCSLSLLKSLHLDFNSLSALPSEIGRLSNLLELYAGGNRINAIPVGMKSCSQLRLLSLWRNELKNMSIPPELESLTNLITLELDFNGISDFSELCHLSSLHRLSLSFNRISTIPKLVSNLFRLRVLDISGNCVENIDQLALTGLTALIELNCGHNQLTEIPTSISHCTNLQTLKLDDNNIDMIPAEINSLDSLIVLSMGQNKVRNLHSGVREMKGLRVLNLDDNLIEEIPSVKRHKTPSTFAPSPRPPPLSELSISNNLLKSLPKDLGSLKNLMILTLSNNSLSTIPPSIGKCVCLKQLSVAGNSIDTIPHEICMCSQLEVFEFDGCNDVGFVSAYERGICSMMEYCRKKLADPYPMIKLTEEQRRIDLDLSNRDLTLVPNTLQSLTWLSTLDLSENEFGQEPKGSENGTPISEFAFNGIPYLTQIDISSCGLKSIPISICKLSRLKSLKLSSNLLCNLPTEITSLSSLLALNVSGNRIERFSDHMLQLASLEFLDISYNKLTIIPESINTLLNLKSLICSNNSNLFILPSSLSSLPRLSLLDSCFCSVERIPQSWCDLRNIENFNISSNKIKYLAPNLFLKWGKVREIHLSHNCIEKIPDVGGLERIEYFYGNNNCVTEIVVDEESKGLTKLKELALSNNNLGELPVSMYSSLKSLCVLNLDANLISTFPPEFGKLESLTKLTLSGDQFQSLPECLAKCTKLEQLVIAGNLFTEIPSVLYQLTCLVSVDISHNDINGSTVLTAKENITEDGLIGGVYSDIFHSLPLLDTLIADNGINIRS